MFNRREFLGVLGVGMVGVPLWNRVQEVFLIESTVPDVRLPVQRFNRLSTEHQPKEIAVLLEVTVLERDWKQWKSVLDPGSRPFGTKFYCGGLDFCSFRWPTYTLFRRVGKQTWWLPEIVPESVGSLRGPEITWTFRTTQNWM